MKFDFREVWSLKPPVFPGKPSFSGPPPGAEDRPQAAQVRPLGRNCLPRLIFCKENQTINEESVRNCLSLYSLA
jgi:hypothetical protein